MFLRSIVAILLLVVPLSASTVEDRKIQLNQTIDQLWKALSNDPGKAGDVAVLKSLFHPKAQIEGVRFKDSRPELTFISFEDFLAAQSKLSDQGFFEPEIHRKVEVYSNFAQVFSIVESRRALQDPIPMFTGVNSIQLFWDGKKWVIINLYYHLEDPGIPIPKNCC